MKKIVSLMLGMTFVLGTAAFAAPQDQSTAGTTDKKAEKKKKKGKKHADKMSGDSSAAPKQ